MLCCSSERVNTTIGEEPMRDDIDAYIIASITVLFLVSTVLALLQP